MFPIFAFKKKKDHFKITLFGKEIIFYRYLRMIREIFLWQHFFVLKDTLKNKFNVSLPTEAYYHLSGDVELVKIPLKDIKSIHKGKLLPLPQTPLFKKLIEDKKYCEDDAEGHIYLKDDDDKYKKFQSLVDSLEQYEYDPSKCVIALRHDNCLLDGYHRCCLLFHKYGENYKVLVVREKK